MQLRRAVAVPVPAHSFSTFKEAEYDVPSRNVGG